jgi:poly(A) polymerase
MTLETKGTYKARIPAHVRGIMEHLSESGFESYLVGGAVRDMLLDSTPADFDLASNATPIRSFGYFTVTPSSRPALRTAP